MKLNKPRFIYPPRPNGAVPFAEIQHYGELGFVGQFKFNDSRTAISYLPDGSYELWNRNKTKSPFTPSEELNEQILELRSVLELAPDKWSYLDCGLLHKKHKAIKNSLVVWDILVQNDEYLTETVYESRFSKLKEHAKDPYIYDGLVLGHKLTEDILIPRELDPSEWEEAWNELNRVNKTIGFVDETSPIGPLIEGFVLKLPSGKLEYASKEENNVSWSIRCRIRTGRHRF